MLTAGAGRGREFRIYVLDARLTRAAEASPVCRVADLASALSDALADEGPIVSWSQHDLRIVRRAGLPARLVEHCEARWVNALIDVRRWKNRLYRDRDLQALGAADGHTLKAYMKAVGYAVPAALAPGQAARWLRQVLERLDAADGDYRTLSARAKRQWHALLAYNRHDCFGIRAVYERARRELRLEAAYRQTTYRVRMDEASHPIRIGRVHPALDRALGTARVTRWACITAYNPQSTRRPARQNQRCDAALKRRLRDLGVRWFPMESRGDRGDWPPELGVLALGVSRSRAESLGREFNQAAIVWGNAGGQAELVWCNRLKHL